MKPTVNYGLSNSLIDAVRKAVEEAKLHPNQQKLDVHEPEKDELTSQDFKKLRAGKKVKDGIDTKPKLKEEEEEVEQMEEQIDKVAKHNAAVAKLPNGHAHRSNHPHLLKKAPEGYFFNISHKLVPDKQGVAEEVDQMDEAVKNFDVEPKRAWKIVHHLNGVGIRTKTEANDDRGSVNIKATHKDPAHLAIHISRAVDAHAQDHALSARMRGQLRASGVEPKPMKKEEYEQMDEAPLRAVSALVGYPKLNRKIASKGTPGSEDERNKAAAGLRKDRSGLGRRAYTGDQHYDVRREEEEQIDELSVNKMLKYTDAANKNREVLNTKWDKGTATEREKNKVLGHESGVDRAASRVKAKTGKNPNEIGKLSRMKYAITKEEEQMDEDFTNKKYSFDAKPYAHLDQRDTGGSVHHTHPEYFIRTSANQHLAKHIEKAKTHKDASTQRIANSSHKELKRRVADGSAPEKYKAHLKEEEEQMDEAPMKSGAQSRREVDSVMDKYGFGSKQKEAPKSNIRKVVGKSYGADYKDPEGEDETAADMKKPEPKRKSGPQGTMARRFNTKSYEKIKGKLKAQY